MGLEARGPLEMIDAEDGKNWMKLERLSVSL
jgi:hypothetical protein